MVGLTFLSRESAGRLECKFHFRILIRSAEHVKDLEYRIFAELHRHSIAHTNLNTFANGKGVGRLRQWQHYIGIAAHSLLLSNYQLDTQLLDNLTHLLCDAVVGNNDIDLFEWGNMAKASLSQL